jgi:hypothetical protein
MERRCWSARISGGGVATRARDAGADEVLKKPLLARDLAASLARVLHP